MRLAYYLMPFVSYASSDSRTKVTRCFKIKIFTHIANRWLEFAIHFLTFYSHVHVSFSSFSMIGGEEDELQVIDESDVF